MFVYLLKDTLNEYSYAAQLAGLSYSIANMKNKIIVSVKNVAKMLSNEILIKLLRFTILQIGVSGYNEKLPVLLRKVVDKLVNFEIDAKRFEIIKELVSANAPKCRTFRVGTN